VVVASLAKAFGASGGIAMLGDERMLRFLYRNAGPVAWSQNMDVAAIGAALGSLAVHRTSELAELQGRLRRNIAYFDRQFPTGHAGNGLPIRKITVVEEARAVRLSRDLYERGYYCSAVFFPIVARGDAGVRVMMRADIEPAELERFCKTANDLVAGM
jgi:7-keto-8-aminopelargonate synthetase-like enzyme